jgi:hypothetical protein
LSEKLPVLKIIPLEDIILHEDHSPERAERLAKRITEDTKLRNPILVSRINKIGKYMVLDGATRTTALKSLGFRDVLTQVVNYYSNDITLDTWHHLIPARGRNGFFEDLTSRYGVIFENASMQKAETLLRKRQIMSYFLFFDNTCLTLRESTGKPSEQVKKLRDVVLGCETLGKIVRIHYTEVGESLRKDSSVFMANIFPSYSKEELIRFAQSGIRLPAGITRHIVPGRVLGFEMQTSFLRSHKISVHKKNELLQKMLEQKIVQNNMRFYPESVFVFND